MAEAVATGPPRVKAAAAASAAARVRGAFLVMENIFSFDMSGADNALRMCGRIGLSDHRASYE
ncbi:hypothetical protein GCM10020227_29710 [Streptomyces flavovirens]